MFFPSAIGPVAAEFFAVPFTLRFLHRASRRDLVWHKEAQRQGTKESYVGSRQILHDGSAFVDLG